MKREEAIQTLNVMQSSYAHIRHSDAEWEALEMAKEALGKCNSYMDDKILEADAWTDDELKSIKNMLQDNSSSMIPRVNVLTDSLRIRKENKPISLDQLWGMDEEPAYVCPPDDQDLGNWVLIKQEEGEADKKESVQAVMGNGWILHFEAKSYGKTWVAYAYAPASIDKEAWTAEWAEYTGADAGFHYCSKCKQQAFNYEDGGEVVEVLSDFCPGCARAMTEKGLSELKKRMGLA